MLRSRFVGIVLIPVFLGLCWRARGSGWFDANGLFDLHYTQLYRQLWAIPYAAVVFLYARSRGVRLNPLFLYLAAFAMLLNGHNAHMDMGRWAPDDEVFTFWLPSYSMADPLWYREMIDFIGLSVIGALRGLILAAPFMDKRALILCLGGPVSALGYLIGWDINPFGGLVLIWHPYLETTGTGEFATGLGYGLLSIILIHRMSQLTVATPRGLTRR